MYECIRHDVEFVLAGSIRDDGPLPDTIMDLREAQLARARPGELNYASGTIGATPFLAGELFNYMAKVKIVRIAYKGTGPSMIGVMSGESQLMFPGAGSVWSHVEQGRLRALGVASLKPSPLTPGLEPIALTVPGYESTSNIAFFAPAKTPQAIIDRLHQEIVKAVHRPEVKDVMFKGGVEPAGSDAQRARRLRGDGHRPHHENARRDRIQERTRCRMNDPTYNYDVLIVGGGNAACSAAHAALEKTKSVASSRKRPSATAAATARMTGHMRFVFNGIEDLRPLVRDMSDDELHKLLDGGLPKRDRGDVLGRDDARHQQSERSGPAAGARHASRSKTVQWLASKGPRLGAGAVSRTTTCSR